MAITWIDGFDLYSATVGLTSRYAVTGTPTIGRPARFTGFAVQLSNVSDVSAPFAATANLSVGIAVNVSSIAGYSTGGALFFLRNAGSIICRLGVDVNGAIKFGRGDFVANLICTSANGLFTAPGWHYIELEFLRSATVGTVNIYLNGVSVATATGANTGASNIDSVRIGPSATGTIDVDDFYINNTVTKLGERRVETLYPTSDTAQVDFTPSTGTNHFALVDEAVYNGDTDYNASGTVGHKDRYGMGNLSATPTAISAVQVTYAHRKDDATARTLRSNLKSGATTQNGQTVGAAASYGVTVDLYETDPDTAAAWTGSGVNALEAGAEIVS